MTNTGMLNLFAFFVAFTSFSSCPPRRFVAGYGERSAVSGRSSGYCVPLWNTEMAIPASSFEIFEVRSLSTQIPPAPRYIR